MAMESQVKAKSLVEHNSSQIFQFYSNFLSEEARQCWKKILAKQIDSSSLKDLRGIVHNCPRRKTFDSFQKCITFHKLMVFWNNANGTDILHY